MVPKSCNHLYNIFYCTNFLTLEHCERAPIPQEDIWFGSTPNPMYRGYVTSNINQPPKNVGAHFYKGV